MTIESQPRKQDAAMQQIAREAEADLQCGVFSSQEAGRRATLKNTRIILSAIERATGDDWQILHDKIIDVLPQEFRQNSHGASDCVRKLVKAYDEAMQENHQFRHGHRKTVQSPDLARHDELVRKPLVDLILECREAVAFLSDKVTYDEMVTPTRHTTSSLCKAIDDALAKVKELSPKHVLD